MTRSRPVTPGIVLTYGLLGIIPFVAPAIAEIALPAINRPASLALALYAGLILSFLGGARWGFANATVHPRLTTVSLSMLPSLAALALLALPAGQRRLQLCGLAAALALHWLWDVRAAGLPDWYPRLRTVLTAGALTGLLAGAIAAT